MKQRQKLQAALAELELLRAQVEAAPVKAAFAFRGDALVFLCEECASGAAAVGAVCVGSVKGEAIPCDGAHAQGGRRND